MDVTYGCLRPLLFQFDAERAHQMVLTGASMVGRQPMLRAMARSLYAPSPDPALEIELWGSRFSHPFGVAAGLDKDGVAIDAWAALGFGFMELGTVTPGQGQPGNPRPRLERMPHHRAVVNKLGFPNKGAEALANRIASRISTIPIGTNIGKAKSTPMDRAADDYCSVLGTVFDVSDYIVVNVSSPNTAGLRDLQSIQMLRPLLSRIQQENSALAAQKNTRPRPILVKIAPDLADEDVDAVADLAVELGLDGLVATNTTIRLDLVDPLPSVQGGLSGAPLGPRSLDLTRRLYRRLGSKIPIIGVGGIMSAEDAWQRIRAGATLLQSYTGLIYEGPGLIRSVVNGLSHRLRVEGFSSVREAVGSGVGD
ncbi:MAG: quinone-dependent dihydroorotate dehydrogenase [Myxococcales bacterium]|nr:quinone-dependent dihydroorotate dehydrogenase [Myxococcales bacterium]